MHAPQANQDVRGLEKAPVALDNKAQKQRDKEADPPDTCPVCLHQHTVNYGHTAAWKQLGL
jgi:hypothetical protein